MQNVVERAAILARNGQIQLALPRSTSGQSPSRKTNLHTQPPLVSLSELKARERSLILEALATTGGKIYGPDGAAVLLDLKPTTLSSRIHRMGLKKF